MTAFVNGVIQIGVIWAALAVVRNPVQRAVIVALAGGALLCSVAGLLWAVWAGYADAQRLPHTLLSDIVMWVVYVVIGLAVAVGVVSALRSQRTRFVWPQGKYHRYRSYRRI